MDKKGKENYITDKEREFALRLLAGDGPSLAYKTVWPERGEDRSKGGLAVVASRLAEKPGVRHFCKQATMAGLARALPTVEEHAAQLSRLRELALEQKQVAAAVSAEFRRGQVAGHYAGKGDDNGRQPDKDALATALAAIGLGALAERLNRLPGDDAKLINQE